MRTVSFIARTSLALTAAAVAAGSADAGLVFDSFASSGQSVLAGGSLVLTRVDATPSTSGTSASIAPVAGSRNARVATAAWESYGDVFYTDAEKGARYANTIIDTTAGAAIFGFGGKVDIARGSLSYGSQPGSWMNLSGNGYGIGLEGSLTSSLGITGGFDNGMTIDIVITDRFGVSANYVFFSNGATAGDVSGLDGSLAANFAAFQWIRPDGYFGPDQTVDFTQVANVAVNFEYLNFGFGAPDVVGSYQLNQITLLPAPGAIALLAAAGLVGSSRRRL